MNKLFTSQEERKIRMAQLRTVTHFEKVVFPLVTTTFTSPLLPSVCSLIGMLMLGNLFTESGCMDRLIQPLKIKPLKMKKHPEFPNLLLFESLDKLSGIEHFCTTRNGGVSKGSFSSLNLGKIGRASCRERV